MPVGPDVIPDLNLARLNLAKRLAFLYAKDETNAQYLNLRLDGGTRELFTRDPDARTRLATIEATLGTIDADILGVPYKESDYLVAAAVALPLGGAWTDITGWLDLRQWARWDWGIINEGNVNPVTGWRIWDCYADDGVNAGVLFETTAAVAPLSMRRFLAENESWASGTPARFVKIQGASTLGTSAKAFLFRRRY